MTADNSETRATPAGDDGQQRPEEPPNPIAKLLNVVMMYFLFQRFVTSVFSPTPSPETTPGADDAAAVAGNGHRPKIKPAGASSSSPFRPKFHLPIWSAADDLALDIYFVESPLPADGVEGSGKFGRSDDADGSSSALLPPGPVLSHLSLPPVSIRDGKIVFSPSGDGSDDFPGNRRHVTLPVGKSMHDNRTSVVAVASLYDAKTGKSTRVTAPMYKFLRRKPAREEKSLLGEGAETEDDDAAAAAAADDSVLGRAAYNASLDTYLGYLRPTFSLEIIAPRDQFKYDTIPDQIFKYMDVEEKTGAYFPILHMSTFWTTRASMIPINGTVNDVDVLVEVYDNPIWKWQLKVQMEETWEKQEAMGASDGKDNDMVRNMLMDTNPFLLAITFAVSILHTVFDFLAFKNDISFYKKQKSMVGLSVRTMSINAFFSIIIFLYLADNDTSTMVLLSNAVGCCIEIWKLSRAVKISFVDGKLSWIEAESYAKSTTKEYDEIATNHLLYVTMPLVTGYGTYSLMHMKHRGWYSWIISTLVGFIYMFGFVMMTPQLFINYKLKSVAHLNWRTLTYKSLNTFVDDLFAFVIKMPLMHRLACLRDDFVFFIFLYQRHAYKVDYTRVNEYGQCEQPEEGGDEKKAILEVAKEDDATASTRDANAGTERTDTDDFRKPRRDKRAPIE